MTSLLIAASFATLPAPPLPLKVISASLFKNGYAVVVREAAFTGSGVWSIEDLPQAVLGTLWITATKGSKLSEVVMTTVEEDGERNAQSLEEVLSANVGRDLEFVRNDRTGIVGTLLSASGNILIVERKDSEGKRTGTLALSKGTIVEINSSHGDMVWKIKETRQRRVLRFKADSPGKASIFIVALERGLTWAPAYSVDITDPKRLHLVSKATILNDLAPLEGIEVRLVTGFPNIPYINLWDPLTTQLSVDQWVNGLISAGTPDQYRAPGGFGGQMAANARLAERDFAEAFPTSNLPGLQAEDLFFYRQPDVRLKRGDRGYYVLFAADSEFEHIYEWEIADQIQDTSYVERKDVADDVWHSLKFKNTSGRPLTTASAITMKDGEILGQDMMRYTSAGADATVRITKALDVRAESAEEEVERKRDALQLRSGYFDLVTLRGTLQVVNRKADAIKLKVTKYLTGEVQSADPKPKVTALAKGLRAVNPRQRLEWTLDLKPGESVKGTYTYTVYINR